MTIILLYNKKTKRKSGHIKFKDIYSCFSMFLTQNLNLEFFQEFQNLILKYYNIKILSNQKITNKLIDQRIKDQQYKK